MDSIFRVVSRLDSQIKFNNKKRETLIVVNQVYSEFHAKKTKWHSSHCIEYRDEFIKEVDAKLQDIVDIIENRTNLDYYTMIADNTIQTTLDLISNLSHCLCEERDNGESSACDIALRLELKSYRKYHDPSSIRPDTGNSECSIDLS